MTRRVLNAQPGAGNNKLKRALSLAGGEPEIEARINRISRMFVGRRYADNPLGGGPHTQEVFRASFDSFDCVTYVETVISLASSNTPEGFYRKLRTLRYEEGKIGWRTRNHFMTTWLRRNIKRGSIVDLTRGQGTLSKTRTLSGVAGLQPQQVTFRYYPKRLISRVRSRVRTGDLMIFVSTKKHLDVFHMGILICEDHRLLLRHATRSVGKVIEQNVDDFLQANRMTGFIIARPLCQE
jgi:hypothetical protein